MRKVIAGTCASYLALGLVAYAAKGADLGKPKGKPEANDAPGLAMISCYGLASAGFALAQSKVGDAAASLPIGATGTFAAIGGGCDYKVQGILVGAWGDYAPGSTKAQVRDPAGATDLAIRNKWGIGARLGYMVQSTTLLYGAAGYTGATVEATSAGFAAEQELRGLTLGAGLETQISGPVWFRFGAEWTRFGKDNLDAARIDATIVETRAGIMVRW